MYNLSLIQKKKILVESINFIKYNYDNFGNLRTVIKADSSIIEYKINASNQRIAKVTYPSGAGQSGQIEKKWLYSGGLLPVAELDSADNISVLYGPGYIVKNDTTYRIITNHLGSVKLIVNASTGEIVLSNSYNEWGNLTAQTGNTEWLNYDFTFAGGLYDPDTKLVRFGARDYDPEIGRWTAKDPLGFGGGQSNFYVYVNNSPTIYTDKIGLGRFGYRRLHFGLGPLNPIIMGGAVDEANNTMIAHEHYWFDDNERNTGYGNHGMMNGTGEKFEDYRFKDEYFDDNIMEQAIKNTQWSGDDYKLFGKKFTDGVNCQDWADAVRAEYYRLKKEMEAQNPCQ